jgi:hypothetical protein
MLEIQMTNLDNLKKSAKNENLQLSTPKEIVLLQHDLEQTRSELAKLKKEKKSQRDFFNNFETYMNNMKELEQENKRLKGIMFSNCEQNSQRENLKVKKLLRENLELKKREKKNERVREANKRLSDEVQRLQRILKNSSLMGKGDAVLGNEVQKVKFLGPTMIKSEWVCPAGVRGDKDGVMNPESD